MSFYVTVDTASPTPPFEQIRLQISEAIDAGALEINTALPSVRQLANDLGIANGTVARAYRELEREEKIESRRGKGTTVRASARPTAELLAERADTYIAASRTLGVEDEAIISAVRERL